MARVKVTLVFKDEKERLHSFVRVFEDETFVGAQNVDLIVNGKLCTAPVEWSNAPLGAARERVTASIRLKPIPYRHARMPDETDEDRKKRVWISDAEEDADWKREFG